MTQQNLRQTSFRAISGTEGTYDEDSRAAFATEALVFPGDTYNEAWIKWLQVRLDSTDENLPNLMAAFATLQGATNWSSVGSFAPFGPDGPGGVIRGLQFWLRADNFSSFDDIDAIGEWTDKGPTGLNHAIQTGAGSLKPQVAVPLNSNGRFAVRFDGVNDFLSVTTPPDLSPGCSFLVVYHVWTRTDFDGVLSFGDAGTTDDVDNFFTFQLNTAASGDMQVFGRDVEVGVGDNIVLIQPDPERIAQALVVIEGVADPVQEAEYRDAVNSNVGDAFADHTFGTPDDIILGARAKALGVANELEVDLYEVACWTVDELTSAERDAIEAYVETRYALSTATVPARLLLDTGGAFLINGPGGNTGFLQLG